VRGNRTGKGWFVKGRSANPGGRPKNPAILREYAPDLTAADRRPILNLVVEARRFSALAIDTLVELTKTKYSGSTRYTAATTLLDRGRIKREMEEGRPGDRAPAQKPGQRGRVSARQGRFFCAAQHQRPGISPNCNGGNKFVQRVLGCAGMRNGGDTRCHNIASTISKKTDERLSQELI
jgi:hypothetical protein